MMWLRYVVYGFDGLVMLTLATLAANDHVEIRVMLANMIVKSFKLML